MKIIWKLQFNYTRIKSATQYEAIAIRDITFVSLALLLLFQYRCCYVVNKCCDVIHFRFAMMYIVTIIYLCLF